MQEVTDKMTGPDLFEYRWPAEWEPHAATWLSWPVKPQTWPGIFDRIPAAFARLVAAIARFEPVRILGTADVQQKACPLIESECEKAASSYEVSFYDVAVNDSWCRDYGPIFLNRRNDVSVGPPQVILDPRYNAWGGKYPPWDLDEAAAQKIAALIDVPRVRLNLVLEGGAIDGNGAGTLLTTGSCVLHPNRNHSPEQESMEHIFRSCLQVEQIAWLPGGGVEGDDTDGHIDQIARFADERTVMVASAFSQDAPEAAALRANKDALADFAERSGRPLNIIPLRMPAPLYQQQHRLPASYCNFYICNGAVVMPLFGDPADEMAAAALQSVFPDRQVVGVDSKDLVWGLGSFHCLTQQQPLPPG